MDGPTIARKQLLGLQQRREQAEQDFPVMREIQREQSYVGLENYKPENT